MDLNHARLPIPPRWQSNLLSSGGPKATESGRPTFLFYRHEATCQTIDWCRFTASVLCGPLPSLANMPQHSGRIHDISNPKPPWLHGWRARRLYFEFSRQVKSLNVRPPGVEIIHHELHHEVLSQFLLIIALKDETAGAGPENCYISIQKFFETQRLIETLRKRKVPCRYKWPRQFVSARNLQHPSPLNHFVAGSRQLMNRRYCRRAPGPYPSFAVIEIFAFNTFDTGHPFSAASAYFWKVAASAPGTFPTTSIWLAVIVHPESSFSIVSVILVLMLSGVRLAPPSCTDSAIEKHAACAAAINSSGFVPGPFSNREVKEYCVSFNTPPGAEIDPFPSFSPPFHTALALRSILSS